MRILGINLVIHMVITQALYDDARLIILGYRPKFGDPSIASLTVGGDDIDFPGILFNCILEFHIWGGPTQRSCDEQRNHTWSLLKDPALVDNVDQNIKKVVAKGRNRTAGGDFKLYVTGYPQFFNQDTSECNNVTFARTANPNPDGKEHSNMTTELRTEFNNMSKALKAAVQSATLRNTKQGVTFIDIETNSDGSDALSGHRFCELGIKEPDQNNPNLWFWHYPYSQANDDTSPALSDPQMNILIDAYNRTIQGLSTNAINSRWPSFNNLTNAVYDSLNERRIQALGNGTNTSGNSTDPRTDGFWDWIGFRVKVFHPQVAYHTFIMDGILQAYLNGSSLTTTSNTTNISTAASSTRFHRYAYIP